MRFAPIALFTYNRLEHTRSTVEALLRNELAAESDLFVFSDGPKFPKDGVKVEAVRKYLGSISGFNSINIVCQPVNSGLAKSIINGVTSLFRVHERAIVLEDDLVTSPYFLRYMNEALALYENTSEVISIHGYIYPVQESLPETFFVRGADCWGWATWRRGWNLFEPDGTRLLNELESRRLTEEFDFGGSAGYTTMLRQQIAGINNSWAIRWYASAFLADKLTLYPGRSLVQNIGLDGSGVHCGASSKLDVSLGDRSIQLDKLEPVEHFKARAAIRCYFQRLKPTRSSSLRQIVQKLIRRAN